MDAMVHLITFKLCLVSSMSCVSFRICHAMVEFDGFVLLTVFLGFVLDDEESLILSSLLELEILLCGLDEFFEFFMWYSWIEKCRAPQWAPNVNRKNRVDGVKPRSLLIESVYNRGRMIVENNLPP
ncbi:hypothetical protein SLEP1_g5352 [Rubroshorea leprosula]|uniref:Uncharacterized protein n=1 Tax=Rubroshorea leprosula TaxID=152421 RepID=A0AAV5HXI9_9ROSI|nr:hypothetical protein SLEP1_g5352 [Rubroshorea leprosula]